MLHKNLINLAIFKSKRFNKESNENSQYYDINNLAKNILEHEGLTTGNKTPFRIDPNNKGMRDWRTLHGFPVYTVKGSNFFHAKNPDHIKNMIIEQLKNYVKQPQRYNLNQNPTIEEAMKVFDTTGTEGKLKYLEDQYKRRSLKTLPLEFFTRGNRLENVQVK
jgi:hypothetical protein